MFDPAPAEPPVASAAPPRILPLHRIGALIEVLLCSGFPTQLFLVVVMTSARMQLQGSDGEWSLLFVMTLSLFDTALVIAFVLFFLRAHHERARDVLFGDRPVRPEVVVGFALLPLVFVLSLLMLGVIFVVAPDLHNVPRNPLEGMLRSRLQAAIFGVVAMIAGGVREEIQRGFILHRFRGYLGGGAVGVVVHSTLFGLGHVDQGWDAAITVAMLGAIWGTVYLMRGSIVAPVVSHAGFNLAQVVRFFVVR